VPAVTPDPAGKATPQPDLRDSVCLMVEAAARIHGLPLEFQIRVGTDTREAANALCAGIRRAGGACIVLRNRPS
jgi:hypothetical protein